MGTGNSRNFKNTAGASMPGLPIFIGGDYEVKSNRYYIMQYVKGFIKWRELTLILGEKNDVLNKSKYGLTIIVDSLDLINQIKLFDVGRNSVYDLATWAYVILNSDIFCYVKSEEQDLKYCLFAILNEKEIDMAFLQKILRRLREI